MTTFYLIGMQILQSLIERRDLSEELTQQALKVQIHWHVISTKQWVQVNTLKDSNNIDASDRLGWIKKYPLFW